jgi:hypothetical protein
MASAGLSQDDYGLVLLDVKFGWGWSKTWFFLRRKGENGGFLRNGIVEMFSHEVKFPASCCILEST